MAKKFRLAESELRPLVKAMGGCIASDRITVDGAKVGSMVRVLPDRDRDSGWQFFAGDEAQDYIDDPDKAGIYDVNTIANYDPAIIPYLYALPGAIFDRDPASERFVEAPDSHPDPDAAALPEGVQVVSGLYPIGDSWSISLPTPFRQRFDERLVLWRPGLTLFIEARSVRTPIAQRLSELEATIPQAAFDRTRTERDGLTDLGFRYAVEGTDATAPTLVTFIVGATGDVDVSAYFDRESELSSVTSLLRTIRPVGLA